MTRTSQCLPATRRQAHDLGVGGRQKPEPTQLTGTVGARITHAERWTPMALRNEHLIGEPAGLSPLDLQPNAEPAAYLTAHTTDSRGAQIVEVSAVRDRSSPISDKRESRQFSPS